MTSPRRVTNPLTDFVVVPSSPPRSINLERDLSGSNAGYIPAGRALDLLGRIATAMVEPRAGRAWSVTGPYGSGKSSFALFLHALTGPDRDPLRLAAERALRDADPALFQSFSAGLRALGAQGSGFCRALVTAQQEPVTETIARGLAGAVRRFSAHRRGPKPRLREFERMQARIDDGVALSAAEILAVVEELRRIAPILLVIDEFGKNLESWRESAPGSDLYVLQQLAEKAWESAGAPVFLITLQHLAFEDYSKSGPEASRRELTKVQGRFEDVPFVDSPAVGVRLIRQSLRSGPRAQELTVGLNAFARAAKRECDRLNLTRLLDADTDLFKATYPLHPISLAVLPELCARYAQNHRTLFTFLSSREPGSLRSFLESTASRPDCKAPLFTCDLVYDYFVESANGVRAAGAQASRWFEVERRIREAPGLDWDDLRCLKIVGLLNLVATAGSLRASADVVAAALLAPGSPRGAVVAVAGRLRRLEQEGFITYRSFSDEYRLWQGSDFDITAHVQEAASALESAAPGQLLAQLNPLSPVVAARHSQTKGILRYFQRLIADDSGVTGAVLDEADGYVVYLLGRDPNPCLTELEPRHRPIIVIRAHDYAPLADAVIEATALVNVLRDESLREDWVARREIQERVAIAQQRVRNRFSATFALTENDVAWYATGFEEAVNVQHGLSRALSDICDRIYPESPVVQNEMIARAELTSQGARARRELIEAMLQYQGQPRLMLEGYGPERAIYEAVFALSGLHRQAVDGGWQFQAPRPSSTFASVWKSMNRALDAARTEAMTAADLGRAMKAPPYGLKEGLIPLLITAVLLSRADDVGVYQDGSYQASLTPDLVERMIKAPDRVSFRSFPVRGFHSEILEGVGRLFETRPGKYRYRNATVMSAAIPLIDVGRNLSPFAQRTKSIGAVAQAVRDELLNAREPDQLLFEALPRACGVDSWPRARLARTDALAKFLVILEGAIMELRAAFPQLLTRVTKALAYNLGVPAHAELRADIASRSDRLLSTVGDQRLKSLLWIASDKSLDDEGWLEAVATNLAERPPSAWRDDDELVFNSRLREYSGRLRRVEFLQLEQRATPRAGFEAKRIAVTAADGGEINRVVWLDPQTERSLADLLEPAIAGSEERIGTAGPGALLAMLAERLYSAEPTESKMEGAK